MTTIAHTYPAIPPPREFGSIHVGYDPTIDTNGYTRKFDGTSVSF